MTKIDLKQLTPEQRKAMIEELKAEEAVKAKEREQDIEAYKSLVSYTVLEAFLVLNAISAELATQKKSIRDSFGAVLNMKSELYGVKKGQFSHQFISAKGTHRIRIGSHVVDSYDDTVDAGIEKVKGYINSLAKDEQSSMLVETVLKLLSKDSKGTLKASRVLQLQQMADRSGDTSFIEGVNIIRDAYQPIESKSYIRAEHKDKNGAWVNVPLGMTEV